MSDLLIKNPNGFEYGFTAITKKEEKQNGTGIDFGILKLKRGETFILNKPLETAVLLLEGEVNFSFDEISYVGTRFSLFEELPIVMHLSKKNKGYIKALSEAELAIIQVENNNLFSPMIFDKTNLLPIEHRGKGKLENTAYRKVQTIFDLSNRPQAKLVLGEVLTFPGRWSSYPPHHHLQPEIYHYRFAKQSGFGFSQTGNHNNSDNAVIINHNDTLKILYELDHAQVAAPGYAMYYLWIIRHLDNHPYDGPEFTKAHAWTME